MESGYTRPQKERLRKRKLKQALASQAKARAPGKKGMHGSTKELLAKVQGKPLGRENHRNGLQRGRLEASKPKRRERERLRASCLG